MSCFCSVHATEEEAQPVEAQHGFHAAPARAVPAGAAGGGPQSGRGHTGRTLAAGPRPFGTRGAGPNAAGGAVFDPARARPRVEAYFITTARLTVNVSSVPDFSTTW